MRREEPHHARTVGPGGDGKDQSRSRSQSNEVYVAAGKLIGQIMRLTPSTEAKGKVFREFHSDVMLAVGPKVGMLWCNKTLNHTNVPLLQRNTWFLKKL